MFQRIIRDFRTNQLSNISNMNFLSFLTAGPPPNNRNNNVTSSGFKRQNTVDPATIKENTTRYSGMPPSSRPSTANAPSTKGIISPGSTHTPDTSKQNNLHI